MIQLLIEAFFIGLINIFIYLTLIRFIIDNLVVQLFMIGFLKHLISYLIGIQDYYCRIHKNHTYQSKPSNIIIECLFEGLFFVFIGLLISAFGIKNRYLLLLILGVFIHIFAEFYGIHSLFLIYNCKNDLNN